VITLAARTTLATSHSRAIFECSRQASRALGRRRPCRGRRSDRYSCITAWPQAGHGVDDAVEVGAITHRDTQAKRQRRGTQGTAGTSSEIAGGAGWGSNPRPADYEKPGPALRAHYLHGYHVVVAPVALIAPCAQVTRSTNRSTSHYGDLRMSATERNHRQGLDMPGLRQAGHVVDLDTEVLRLLHHATGMPATAAAAQRSRRTP
jgi:hypothetical protein